MNESVEVISRERIVVSSSNKLACSIILISHPSTTFLLIQRPRTLRRPCMQYSAHRPGSNS